MTYSIFKTPLILSLSSLFFSTSILASDLKVPDNIQVTKVNGKSTSFGLIQKETKVGLNEGRNVIVLHYRDSFEDYDNDDFTNVKSEPYVLIFDSVNSQDYIIQNVDIDDEDKAKQFAENFAVTLFNSSGDSVAKTLTTEHEYLSRIEAYVAQAEKENETVAQTAPRSISAKSSAPEVAIISAAKVSSGNVTTTSESKNTTVNTRRESKSEQTKNPHTLNMLQYWWSQATEAEKKAFKQHISNNN